MSLTRLGLIKTSLIDYPGEVAAVLFTAGCNLRCPFCHNPALVEGPIPEDFIEVEEVFAFLNRRKEVLGGVCITGGEPLANPDLGDLVARIQSYGLKCKVDTNGTFPGRLEHLAPDYVALDIKTSHERYPSLFLDPTGLQQELFTGAPGAKTDLWAQVVKSAQWLISSGIEFEFRTTVVPGLVGSDEIQAITDFISGLSGGLVYVLAGFRPGLTLDPGFSALVPYEDSFLREMQNIALGKGIRCEIRWNRS